MNEAATIEEFLSRYTPEIAAQLRAARAHLATRFPRGVELVYDNYNALVFAFGASERMSDLVLSVAGYPKWTTLFFAKGTELPDPAGILEGSGSRIRGLRLAPPSRLFDPEVQALIAAAQARILPKLEAAPPLRTIIKSVSAKQRPRRPAPAKQGT